MGETQYRVSQRKSYCRVCDKVNMPNEDMIVSIHSFRNRGQEIKICKGCIEKIYQMVLDYDNDKEADPLK